MCPDSSAMLHSDGRAQPVWHRLMQLFIVVTTAVFLLAYAVLILYYRQSWLQIPTPLLTDAAAPSTAITVIIPARNEAQNIGHCVQSILNQNYPTELFEIIVVDDHSTDNTADIVKAFPQKQLRCLLLKDYVTDNKNAYKKKAIEMAIHQASGSLIVTTDADCFMEKHWLSSIAAFYETHQPAFIAAPVAICAGNSFLSIFQALDFMTLQGITGASVHQKMHSMCNGANLAYEKKAFEEVGGFAGIDHIASGDDMLLMHKIYQRHPQRIGFLKSPKAIVQTQPMTTWKAFFNQRIRWASKADKYDDKRIISVLAVVYFLNLLLLMLIIASILQYPLSPYFNMGTIGITLLLLMIKTLVELSFLIPVAKFFGQQKLLWWFPLAQPLHILYTVIAGWLGKFGTYQWKDRQVK